MPLSPKLANPDHTGYDKGKSDAVKQQYWLYVCLQRQRNQVGSVS